MPDHVCLHRSEAPGAVVYAHAAAALSHAVASCNAAADHRRQYMGNRAHADHAAAYLKIAGGYVELAQLNLKLFEELT